MYMDDNSSSRNKDSNKSLPTFHPTYTAETPDPPGQTVTGSQLSRPSCRADTC